MSYFPGDTTPSVDIRGENGATVVGKFDGADYMDVPLSIAPFAYTIVSRDINGNVIGTNTPLPPATGTYFLKSVNGVVGWSA